MIIEKEYKENMKMMNIKKSEKKRTCLSLFQRLKRDTRPCLCDNNQNNYGFFFFFVLFFLQGKFRFLIFFVCVWFVIKVSSSIVCYLKKNMSIKY